MLKLELEFLEAFLLKSFLRALLPLVKPIIGVLIIVEEQLETATLNGGDRFKRLTIF